MEPIMMNKMEIQDEKWKIATLKPDRQDKIFCRLIIFANDQDSVNTINDVLFKYEFLFYKLLWAI